MEIVPWLLDLKVETKTSGDKHCRPGWVQFHCPYCDLTGAKWHLGLNVTNFFFNCYQCGPHRTLETLHLLTGRPWPELKQLWGNWRGSVKAPQSAPQRALKLPQGLGPLTPLQREYVRTRGLNARILETTWGVQGFGHIGRYAFRLFVPIVFDEQPVSWLARRITNKEPRYLTAPKTHERVSAKQLLYGEDLAFPRSVVVTEGVTDAWAIGPGAVATMGLGYTTAQVLRLSRYARRVVCFDSSRPAQRRANELCDLLAVFPGETVRVEVETGSDPAEAEWDELEELRQAYL